MECQWLPPPPNINIRSSAFFIAEAQRVCWKCERSTRVFAYVLPKGHEILEELSEGRTFAADAEYEAWRDLLESMGWVLQATEGVLMYITYLPDKVQARMKSLTDRYWMDFSKTTQSSALFYSSKALFFMILFGLFGGLSHHAIVADFTSVSHVVAAIPWGLPLNVRAHHSV